MSEIADITQRTELERARADGRREALAEVLTRLDGLNGNPLYRKAWKRASIMIADLLKAVNRPITQA